MYAAVSLGKPLRIGVIRVRSGGKTRAHLFPRFSRKPCVLSLRHTYILPCTHIYVYLDAPARFIPRDKETLSLRFSHRGKSAARRMPRPRSRDGIGLSRAI